MESNAHAAQLAGLAIRAELDQIGQTVEQHANSPELSRFFQTGNWIEGSNWISGLKIHTQINSASRPQPHLWLETMNWYLLDAEGILIAHARRWSNLRDASFRDYYLSVIEQPNTTYFSRVYRSVDDGHYKLSICRVVQGTKGERLGVLVATVTTATTDAGAGLTSAEHKTALVAACDTNLPPAGSPATPMPNEFGIFCHPAFSAGVALVPIEHPKIRQLLAADAKIGTASDAWYRDPVASRHPLYSGRWLAGFARVSQTPYAVIYQTRDRVTDALVTAGLVAGLALAALAIWGKIRRRRQPAE